MVIMYAPAPGRIHASLEDGSGSCCCDTRAHRLPGGIRRRVRNRRSPSRVCSRLLALCFSPANGDPACRWLVRRPRHRRDDPSSCFERSGGVSRCFPWRRRAFSAFSRRATRDRILRPALGGVRVETVVVGPLAGVALSLSAGLNASLTLFLAALLARLSPSVDAPADWMTSTWALILLGTFVAAEFVADKIPGLDHLLHVVLMPAALLVGGAVASSQIDGSFGQAEAFLAVLGGSLALITHSTRTGLRGVTSLTTAGHGNAVVSTGEDAGAAGITLTALLLPLLLILVAVVGVFLIAFLWAWRRRRTGEGSKVRIVRV